ncbi:MAG: divergent polysaccharide deacetylase family protein, partial [Ghiorsea sp.]
KAEHVAKKVLEDEIEDSIRQIIQPILEEGTITLTFEDELPEPTPTFKATEASTSAKGRPSSKHLALLIDDVGYDLRALQRLIALPFQINVAILPGAPHAEEAARMAHQHGIKVMLHMPMQTANPKYQQKTEQFYLHNQMSKHDFRSVFEAALAKVPYVEGINNHMGSLLTSNKKYMQWLMELCKKHHLFFIDSRTAASSVAAAQAEKAGIPWNQRDVFLDHKVDPKSLQHAWHTAASCLSEKSNCIIIGHPHKETINFLEHHAQGIQTQSFVAIDSLLHHQP